MKDRNGKLFLPELSEKSASAKAVDAAVAALSLFIGSPKGTRTLTMNRLYASGTLQKTELTIHHISTTRDTSTRYVLFVTELKPPAAVPRRRVRTPGKSRKNGNAIGHQK